MERPRDDLDPIAELRALRPSPRPEFAAGLDARAAAGFPHDERRPGVPIARLARSLRLTSPRRLLVSATTGALAAVAIATAVLVTGGHGTGSFDLRGPQAVTPKPRASGQTRGSSEVQFSGALPTGPLSRNAPATQSAGEASAAAPPHSVESLAQGRSGPYASHAARRDVARAAEIVLGTGPDDVHRDAAKVFETVHAASGIVLRSSIRDGGAGEAGASFDLLVPSGKLGDALASLSAIGEVRSRHESTEDITAPTIGLGERLQDTQAKVEGLLSQLAGTTSDAERAEVEAELNRERGRSAALRSRLNVLHRRTTFSRVSVRIETGEGGSSGAGGGWGLDDGLRDAGRVLAVAAGVAVVGLAALVPLALALLLVTLTYRAWLRRAREHALS
jgi:Domain of unknown function (DUF4349)